MKLIASAVFCVLVLLVSDLKFYSLCFLLLLAASVLLGSPLMNMLRGIKRLRMFRLSKSDYRISRSSP